MLPKPKTKPGAGLERRKVWKTERTARLPNLPSPKPARSARAERLEDFEDGGFADGGFRGRKVWQTEGLADGKS